MEKDINQTMVQMFEWYLPEDGNFWNLAKEKAGELGELGVTHVWLPPAYKGANGKSDVGYGVYDMYDLGEFDQKGTIPTKYGTKDEYLKAVKAFQKKGIKVLADVVLNHRMGGDEKETVMASEDSGSNREQEIAGEKEIEAWTKFTFPGRKGAYSSFTWNASHFDGTDWNEREKRNGVYLFKGKEWDSQVDEEFVNYDYLMGCDLDFDNEEVKNEIKSWGKWYFETTGIDGVRLDAVKHINFGFFGEWLDYMRRETGRDFPAVGEYWSPDVGRLKKYLDYNHGCMRLFDVPLHFNFYNASKSNGNFDMARIFDGTLTGCDSAHAVSFVDNHDTQPGQALCSYVLEWFRPLAYAMILLRNDGLPCVFYGDLYGIGHDNIKPVEGLETMMKVRSRFLYGSRHDYLDDSHRIGWTFEGKPGSTAVAVILTDENQGEKRMYVGKEQAGREYRDILFHNPNPVVIDGEGYGSFFVNGGSVSVYLEKDFKA